MLDSRPTDRCWRETETRELQQLRRTGANTFKGGQYRRRRLCEVRGHYRRHYGLIADHLPHRMSALGLRQLVGEPTLLGGAHQRALGGAEATIDLGHIGRQIKVARQIARVLQHRAGAAPIEHRLQRARYIFIDRRQLPHVLAVRLTGAKATGERGSEKFQRWVAIGISVA